MPRITRKGQTTLTLDFSDLTEVEVSKVIDHYMPEDDGPISVYELHRVLVEGIMYEIRNDQSTADGNHCDTVIGGLPCGNAAEFAMEDGAKLCFECYRLFLLRYGEHTGKKFIDIP